MDNEKLNNEEELETAEEITTETVEETYAEETYAEETAETTDIETVEEVTEETAEAEEADAEAIEAADAEGTEEVAMTKKKTSVIVAIAAGVVVLLGVIFLLIMNLGIFNPYEIGYVDVTGETVADEADKTGYSFKEFKDLYDLPFFLPSTTNINAAGNHIPVKAAMKLSGATLEEVKEQRGYGDDVTENTSIGKATGDLTLAVVLGLAEADKETAEETFAQVKEHYGLGDDVTLETLYKDVRVQIDTKTKEDYLKQQEEAAKQEAEAEEKSE